MDKVKIHKSICDKCNTTYAEKNHDYGDSFAVIRKRMPNAILVRLFDKILRLETLLNGGEQKVKDENIDDTLLDLANYAIMELVEREAENTTTNSKIDKFWEKNEVVNCTEIEAIKKPFDWEAFERSEFAVHCKTEKEAINFCGFSHERGVDWCGGDSRLEGTEWEEYREETCYRKDCYGTVEFYINERIPIVEWSDYMQEPTTEKTSEVEEVKYDWLSTLELSEIVCQRMPCCNGCILEELCQMAEYTDADRKKMIEFLEGEE